MTTQLPPDYENRHRLALALCEHLDINPEHVDLGSLQIELGPDHRHRVTWTGHAHINLDDLTALILKTNHPNDNPDPDDEPRYVRRCPAWSDQGEHCTLEADHHGQHRLT